MSASLALETSGDACSIALAVGDAVYEDHRVEPRAHNRLVLGMIDALLEQAGVARGDLTWIAFGHGPGSFTGVRIAAGVAQGLGWGLGIPVVGVSTLHATALAGAREVGGTDMLVALDARMNQIYWNASRVTDDAVESRMEDRLDEPASLQRWIDSAAGRQGSWVGVGDGWALAGMAPSANRLSCVHPGVRPRARDVLRVGRTRHRHGMSEDATIVAPVYIGGDTPWDRNDGRRS